MINTSTLLSQRRILFSCGIPGVYHTLNNPTVAESIIDETVNRIVSSLFSVAVTMGIPSHGFY